MSCDIQNEVSDMKNKLAVIRDLIQYADRMDEGESEGEESISIGEIKRKQVKVLREVAFRMEDVIDEYMMYVEEQHQHGDAGCVALLICEPFKLFKTMILRLSILNKIKSIKSHLREIEEILSLNRVQVQEQVRSDLREIRIQLQNRELMPLYMEEAEIVGLEASRMKLVSLLVEGTTERTVTCVVGMGGTGKTTLARGVFVNKTVIEHFDCHAWITVSGSYTVEGLLREILHNFCKEGMKHLPSEMDREWLIDEVRHYLRGKRYVIFFDDVWDTQFWDEIEFIAIDNNNGSRIFITTRNKDVAWSCMKSSLVNIHELKPLTSEESLELFCKKAFRFEFDGHCPPELQDISHRIVDKCMGIPLVIVTVAGLISTKRKTVAELEDFSYRMLAEFENNSFLTGITRIISLSYDDLPYYLKPCLLYFGMYPDDYEVDSKRLIMQWIAEGFVKYEEVKTSEELVTKDKEGKTLEEVAEQYLVELINRSLVQVSSLTYDGKVKGCRVHNMIRFMILKKCKDLNFCHYVNEDTNQSALDGEIRRLSIATNFDDSMGISESSLIRSLLFFTNKELSEYFISEIPSKYRLLRVLDFENAQLYYVPKYLKKLFHLSYLSFRNTQVERLPRSIDMLLNLETLDLRQTHVHEMPMEISNLKKLRHLLGDKMSLILLKGCIGGMKSLQTLYEVEIDHGGVELITELEKLLELRKLGLTNVRRVHGRAIFSSATKMKQLEKLYISTKDGDEAIEQDIVDVVPHDRLTVLVNDKILQK
ncbi:hypothetical protein VNO77_43106 [Canavalia gladiata]|uniref:Disease resistance protein RPM1 n=1 Tax=Canavalia gladiata TaxID=3824 RepID=A0AAN9JTH0_CANGL